MHLIYAYIREYRNYKGASISFDSRFDVKFSGGKLSIARGKMDNAALDYMRGGRVDNLHLVVGKTGSGKTNLLQLIGERHDKRSREAWAGEGGSYFFLYHLGGEEFFLETCGLAIDQFPVEEQVEDPTVPVGYDDNISRLQSLRTIRFVLAGNLEAGRPVDEFVEVREFGRDIKPIENPVRDTAFILNAFDAHSFTRPIYEDDRSLSGGEGSGSWVERLVEPYHRASLWSTCDCIREYLSDVEPGEVKKQVAFVVTTHNFAERYPLKLSNALDEEYWTFWERERDARHAGFDKEAAVRSKRRQGRKRQKKLTNKQMFIHDLWTDYAKYLRKWVEKILSYNAEEGIPEDYLDSSGTQDVFQEFVDYYTAKEYGEDFDPSELPDGERLSIVKRCVWLAEYIDRFDARDPHGVLWQACDDIKDICNFLNKLDDKYFVAVDRLEIPVVDMTKKRYRRLFEDLFERMEQYVPDDSGIFTSDLLPYELTCLSTGEHQYARVLGVIEDFLKMLSRDRDGNIKPSDKIILLDEPEAYMHPELARQFLSRLFRLTQKYTNEGSVQVIIGTHSPLLVSDVFSEEVTRLDIDKETGLAIVRNGAGRECFGANIHTILADGFFLDYTIGEDSRAQLQSLYDRLKGYVAERARQGGRIGDDGLIESVRIITPKIGDEFIRMAFENQLRMLEEGR